VAAEVVENISIAEPVQVETVASEAAAAVVEILTVLLTVLRKMRQQI
jgi:hypothetical protein